MSYIAWFKDLNKNSIPVAGGKGANLGEMFNLGLPVPGGFAVTAQTYKAFIERTQIKEKIQEFLKDLNIEETEKLQKAAKDIQNLITSTEIPHTIAEEIMAAYEVLGSKGDAHDFVEGQEVFVAVRSSATAEDLPEASFAGQQATFLNVKGKQHVVDAVLKCWASLFTARAIYYRQKNKFDHAKVLISAIVQKMVNSDRSGIMFTINPSTNEGSEIVIEAVYGLGEMIVGGEVNPDLHIVDKKSREIKKTEIKKQEIGLFRNSKGENEKQKIPESEQTSQVITDKQVIELARYGKKIEEHYGKPQDIEWAIENDNIFIVQSRAVTTFKKSVSKEDSGNQEASGKILVKGETASRGVASGSVRIIHDSSELNKVQKGDILVARMTSPDEVPAMQRAAAIVTDEGGMTCFSSDTKILTNKGFYTIKEIYTKMSGKENYIIPSLSSTDGRIVWKKILAATKRRGTLSQIQVSPTLRSTQNFLKVTRNHKFLTLDDRKICKKEIGKIIDDNEGVLLAEKIPSLLDNDISRNKAYLMGALLSDGHLMKPQQGGYVVGFTQKLVDSKMDFINTVKSNFKAEYSKEMSHKLDPRGNVGQFQCFSKFAYHDVLGFKENIVLEVLTMPEENLLFFLGGIIDGDGTLGHHQVEITISQRNKNLLEAVTIACLRLGIMTNIRKQKTWYQVLISEKIPRLLSHCKRVKGSYNRQLGAKKFVAKQVLNDIIDEVNHRGRIKFAYLTRDQMISSRKITSLFHMISKKDEVQFLLNSEFRMWRVKEEHKLEESDVFNLTVEADNELDHNYLVFTENYSPVIVGNCHAAIVSREMGTPCIVGTEHATEVLKDAQQVTVHASKGVVYEGNVKVESEPKQLQTAGPLKSTDIITATEIKVILDLPNLAGKAAATGADGAGLVRLEIMIATGGIHPAEYVREGKEKDYIALLKEGIGKIATAFKGKPVWVRCSDLRTDEYRNLKGGDQEPKESDPMIGWHAIRRLLDEPKILRAEFQAIRELHYEGHKNVGVMVPFVINVEELREAKEIMRDVGLEPCTAIDFGVMIETPASCWIIEDLCKEGISFVSFGTNDLTQLTLGIDRNNQRIAKLFDEMHPAVLGEIAQVIKVCRKYGVTTSICGQAGSRPEMAEFLVHQGVDSISANADAVDEIRHVVARTERKLLLDKQREK